MLIEILYGRYTRTMKRINIIHHKLLFQNVNHINMVIIVPWTVVIVNRVYHVLWIQGTVALVVRKGGLGHTAQVNLVKRKQ